MNLRDIKKDIEYVIGAFVDDCALFLSVHPGKNADEVANLIDGAVDLFNEGLLRRRPQGTPREDRRPLRPAQRGREEGSRRLGGITYPYEKGARSALRTPFVVFRHPFGEVTTSLQSGRPASRARRPFLRWRRSPSGRRCGRACPFRPGYSRYSRGPRPWSRS